MKRILLKDKFPVYTPEIAKNETRFSNTNEVIDYLKQKIESHPVARLITVSC